MLIDFDKLLKDYLKKHLKDLDPEKDDIEERAADFYEEWIDTPCQRLGGQTPQEYFQSIESAEQLLKMFCEYMDTFGAAPDLLLDELSARSECEDGLIEIAKSPDLKKAKAAMSLLNEMQSDKALVVFSQWFFEDGADEEKLQEAANILAEYPDRAKELVIDKLNKADDRAKAYLADILVYAQPDERIYALLCELFLSGQNYQAYAAYLAKYGDPRAIDILKEALKSADKIDAKEIAAAIEILGDAVDRKQR